jgi:hypothetical protein
MTSREYLFVVDGELSDGVARAFEGMRLHRQDGTTTIEGQCRDQAELLATVMRLSDLGLTLLSLAPKDPGGPASREPRAAAPSVTTAQREDVTSGSHATAARRGTRHGPAT